MNSTQTPEWATVLLVGSESKINLDIQTLLRASNYIVSTVNTYQSAENLFLSQDFDCVVSEVELPDINGIQLLHMIKERKNIPVILLSESAEYMGEDIEVDDFICKPYVPKDILQIVCKVLGREMPKEDLVPTESYCRVDIDEFISGSKLKYDLYVALSNEKYLKVAHAGEALPFDRIQSYKKRGVQFLCLKRDDFKKYIGLVVSLSQVVGPTAGNTSTKDKKVSLLKHTSNLILEDIYSNIFDKTSFDQAKMVLEVTLDLLTDQTDMFNLIASFSASSDSLYLHSIGVSMYSVMIAKELKWSSQPTLYKISMAGLLHDIGKKDFDRTLLQKKKNELSRAELKDLEAHPALGANHIRQVPGISDEIVQIIEQHHENCIGTGYPHKLRKSRIQPIARLIAVADAICHLILKGPNQIEATPEEAFNHLLSSSPEVFDSDYLMALLRVLRIQATDSITKIVQGWNH